MIPTTKSFCSNDFFRFIIHLGLIPNMETTRFDCSWQIIDNVSDLFSFFPLLRVIKLKALISGITYFFLRHTSTVHHVVNINLLAVCRSYYINATT